MSEKTGKDNKKIKNLTYLSFISLRNELYRKRKDYPTITLDCANIFRKFGIQVFIFGSITNCISRASVLNSLVKKTSEIPFVRKSARPSWTRHGC